jgi:hypothetical protein
MNRIPVFVGMDYHQDSVQVCVEGADGRVLANRKCANDIARRLSMLRSVVERSLERPLNRARERRTWRKSW